MTDFAALLVVMLCTFTAVGCGLFGYILGAESQRKPQCKNGNHEFEPSKCKWCGMVQP